MTMTSPARLIGFFFLASVAAAAAQVPLAQDPTHRVMYENAQLRILSVNVPAGATTLDHRHEFDIATVSMNATETRTQATGQPWGPVRPARAVGDASTTEYTGKPGSHRVENVGKTPYQLFAVENRKPGAWSDAPATPGRATKLVRESRAFRIYDVRLQADSPQTAHTHPVPTIVLLVSGKAMSDGPDTHAKANAGAAVGLRQLDQTGQWILVPSGDTHHLVRLSTGDAHVMEIEVR
jgi:hypothetical protein